MSLLYLLCWEHSFKIHLLKVNYKCICFCIYKTLKFQYMENSWWGNVVETTMIWLITSLHFI